MAKPLLDVMESWKCMSILCFMVISLKKTIPFVLKAGFDTDIFLGGGKLLKTFV